MDEDLEIVQRFKAGNAEAFSMLVQKYTKPILNLVFRVSGTPEDVEDITQEVFLRAYKGLKDFKAESKFFTWLYRIAVNVTLRARQRKSKITFQSLEQKTEEGSSSIKCLLADNCGPQDRLEQEELQEKVRQAIMELDEDQRTVIVLFRYQNLSYEEIAQVLNLSVPAVKSRLHRARKTLKEKLEAYVGM